MSMVRSTVLRLQSLGGIPDERYMTSITWSSHLVTFVLKTQETIKAVLDVGAFTSWVDEVNDRQLDEMWDMSEIDVVVLSHVHNDHVGRLMSLIVAWYRWPVVMSNASKAVIVPILEDILVRASEAYDSVARRNSNRATQLQRALSYVYDYEHQHEKKSKRRGGKHTKEAKTQKYFSEERYQSCKKLLKRYQVHSDVDIRSTYETLPNPPFAQEDITQLLAQIRSYKKWEFFEITQKWRASLQLKLSEAWHLEWAVQTTLWLWFDDENGKHHDYRMLYTWDVGRIKEPSAPLKEPAIVPEPLDLTIAESTYGNRIHAPRMPDQQRLLESLQQATNTYMIPTFALGRSVEVLKLMVDRIKDGSLELAEHEKIFFDGKLAEQIAHKFLERYPEHYAFLTSSVIKFIRTPQDRKEVFKQKWRKIIIASGWMMQWWSSVHYLKKILGTKSATIATVGFQAPGTYGHYLQNHDGLIYTYERFEEIKHLLYHHQRTEKDIMYRKPWETLLIPSQKTSDLLHVLIALYRTRDYLEFWENEYIYVDAEFWQDGRKNHRTIERVEAQLRYRLPDVYDYVKDKIKIINLSHAYDSDYDYVPAWSGIHIFWDKKWRTYRNASIDTFYSFSGHADRDELISLFEQQQQHPNHSTVLVHGDFAARKELADHIEKNNRIQTTVISPKLYQEMVFDCLTNERLA